MATTGLAEKSALLLL